MAPHYKAKTPFKGKAQKGDYLKAPQSAATKKQRKWIPADKFFSGSVQEGKGFAFKRKQKIQSQYSKLLRKERWRMKDYKPHLTDNYPEHLKHLYMAEQERLDEEEQVKRNRRRKGREDDDDEEGEDGEENTSATVNSVPETEAAESAETSADVTSNAVPQSSQSQSSQGQWKRKKMSSYQKMKQDHERQKEERERKREEYLKDKHQREEALQKYRDKKKETYNLLKTKTKKGQPNLNLQMELLLQKIQSQRK